MSDEHDILDERTAMWADNVVSEHIQPVAVLLGGGLAARPADL